ncbi:Major facilitator superfamily MFS_1 [Candidatus Glomeribacter gigasporarum BEG34]|uniref:Major facilitator superfamily MFS_1 n=1 Tax=Candidatus Glomeribacter gigasporarum BEG34 TaxID=1070319 RepID=G2J8G3_9BURK|nr:MFS transporter [Candidatus Glomeribacter gigasporarum]CCD29060.1 Major facilitator superfamily MFS_1 [Candidatus Glomeribacter gigasporarum BEG34]
MAASANRSYGAHRHSSTDFHSRNIAIAVAMALPGDTVLYLLLPMHHAVFGATLAQAGLLLAANRLIRLLGYGWIAKLYMRKGSRLTCGLAVTAASLCTLGYATLAGFWGLLMARLLWGVSFAALNISRQALITAEPAGASRRSGRSQSIVAVGPLLGLLGGAFLSQWLGPRAVFFLLTAVALLGLLFALQLPAGAVGPYPKSPKKFRWPKPLHLWSFVQGLALDGFFTTSLSVLSAQALPENAALAAGAVMALRYLADIVLSPLGGYMAGRWGAENQLLGLSFAAAIAMLGIGLEWLWISAVAVVILRSLVIPMVSPIVAMQNPGPARVEALAACTVWRDLGAGIGPMLAGALLPIGSNLILYTGAAAMIAVSVIACYFELKK